MFGDKSLSLSDYPTTSLDRDGIPSTSGLNLQRRWEVCLQDEFNSYFSILTLFGEPHYSPLVIHSVFFVADHKHPETIALRSCTKT
jgi:hypothetical protein